EGGNVMMGYAQSPADLVRGAEIRELRTGDLARVDADGLVEIVGRLSRFAKVCGLRIDLDRVEGDLAAEGHTAYVMDGDDRLLVALIDASQPQVSAVQRQVSERYAVPRPSVVVGTVDEIPRTDSGKVDRPALRNRLLAQSVGRSGAGDDGLRKKSAVGAGVGVEDVRRLFADLLDRPDATNEDSFVSLRGDSLSYVEMSVRLEGLLGTLPTSWHVRSVADLAASHGASPATSARHRRIPGWLRGRVLETSVVLRAVAIALIVLTHAGVLEVRGGAHVLLAVAGYAFARFQLFGAERSDRVAHILESITRIALPSAVWIGVIVLIDERFSWWNAALLTSVGGGAGHIQWRYWFVEALVHLLAGLAVLLCVPAIDRLERARPFAFPLGLALAGLVFRFGLVGVGSHHENGRPAMVLWLFALGWAMARADRTWQRVVLTAYVAVAVPGFFGTPSRELVIAAGLLTLLWARSVRVPAFLVPVLVPLASASLFIYLVQFEVMGRAGYSLLGAVVSVAAGWITWRGASPIIEPCARWIGATVSRRLRSPAPAEAGRVLS
ncbi:MAG: acyltransferase family protein, partial [Knoellia sp.]